MIVASLLLYVSGQIIDEFIGNEGYGFIRRLLFPKTKYINLLRITISESVKEYEINCETDLDNQKIQFYQSQIFFSELCKHVLFSRNNHYDSLIESFKSNPNIVIPTQEELIDFFSIFIYKINHNEQLKKLFIDENYKSRIFEIDIEIKNISQNILSIERIVNPEFTKEWFTKQCSDAILDLGKRYTPELNFELEVAEIFEGIGRTSLFSDMILGKFDDLIIKGRKVVKDGSDLKDKMDLLSETFDRFVILIESIDFLGTSELSINNITELILVIEKTATEIHDFYLEKERAIQKEKNEHQYYHKYGSELRNVRELEGELRSVSEFLDSTTIKLAVRPFLVMDGDAGIGKSHLFGDVVTKRIEKDFDSLFLLGQQFVTDDDPWTQILKRLQINNITAEQFLTKLNLHGESTGKRLIVFIDAINEGRGKYFWQNNIQSFVNSFKKHEWLGLVLSIRSSYKNLIFPPEESSKLNVNFHSIYGFRDVEFEASKLFFTNYKIELPNVPLLHPEFQNPLFLKLFCEGINKSGLTRIPDGLQGITSIIGFFLKSINETLAKPNRIDFSNNINLVQKAVNGFISYKIENGLINIPYEKAYEIIDSAISTFLTKKGFIDELIIEGVLSKNLSWNSVTDEHEEVVYLSFERFEDHLTAQFLIDKYPDLKKEFSVEGSLNALITDHWAIMRNRGLIEALSIQVPEIKGKEFYEIVPLAHDDYEIASAFVASLLWRKFETITENSIDYVNDVVLHYQGTEEYFWDTIISVSALPNHFYNGYFLHRNLFIQDLSDRDAKWTQELRYKYTYESSVKRLIDWAWNEQDKSHISDESIQLAGIALSWFLTSTNRQLRDCATKALVGLLQERIDILIKVMKMFEGVNDPYVYERIFCAAYGCALRTTQIDKLHPLSEYVYKIIFSNQDEVYPHILLRDYARGIIEYSGYIGQNLSFDIQLVRPPYKSAFETEFPSNEFITEKYQLDYKSPEYKKHYLGQNHILSSMATERGRLMYGDFGRYTFQSALGSWKLNSNDLSNLAISWIFEKFGYDVEKHGEFDLSIGSGRGRNTFPNERIGKKYQWIALHEMLARVSDNFIKYEQWGYSDEEEYYLGPWEPFVRDIDPTVLIKKTGVFDAQKIGGAWWEKSVIINWSCNNKDWTTNQENIPDYADLIQMKDSKSEDWLLLEGFHDWSESKKIGEEKWDKPRKEIWSQLRSYLIKSDDLLKFREFGVQQSFMGLWMPGSKEPYEVFYREYYWSPVYHYSIFDGSVEIDWKKVNDPENGNYILDVYVTAIDARLITENDNSKEDSINFLIPGHTIYNGLNLNYGAREGEFIDPTGEIVCFATNMYDESKSQLLIKKSSLLTYLEKNNLSIVWTLLGEKQVIGGRNDDDEHYNSIEFNGVFSFEEDKLIGNVNTRRI